jgi:hypothetical protein
MELSFLAALRMCGGIGVVDHRSYGNVGFV